MNTRILADQLLELLVIPSFTRTGYAVRRRLFAWEDPATWSLAGRTVVLTGPTSGLGREAAGSLARMGARLVLVGRDPGRLEAVRSDLVTSTGNDAIVTAVADMSSLASVRAAADRILATESRIDVIVDNAGAMFAERQLTPEGLERTFATMVLGPFVLVSRLLPRLAESPDPRIVAVTSGGMYTQALPLHDLAFERGSYAGALAYARAKRAQVALVREWARRLRGQGVSVNAMHPGWADTPGLAASLPGSASAWEASFGRRRRAWTRCSGWPRRLMAAPRRAASSWTAAHARSTGCHRRASTAQRAGRSGTRWWR